MFLKENIQFIVKFNEVHFQKVVHRLVDLHGVAGQQKVQKYIYKVGIVRHEEFLQNLDENGENLIRDHKNDEYTKTCDSWSLRDVRKIKTDLLQWK